jgi:hypothetical protein
VTTASRKPPGKGGIVDERLKRLVEELGLAINDSISTSEQISGVAAQIQESGYEVFLFLNATIGVVKRDERPMSSQARKSCRVQSAFNREDVDFLKSMHISVDR